MNRLDEELALPFDRVARNVSRREKSEKINFRARKVAFCALDGEKVRHLTNKLYKVRFTCMYLCLYDIRMLNKMFLKRYFVNLFSKRRRFVFGNKYALVRRPESILFLFPRRFGAATRATLLFAFISSTSSSSSSFSFRRRTDPAKRSRRCRTLRARSKEKRKSSESEKRDVFIF